MSRGNAAGQQALTSRRQPAASIQLCAADCLHCLLQIQPAACKQTTPTPSPRISARSQDADGPALLLLPAAQGKVCADQQLHCLLQVVNGKAWHGEAAGKLLDTRANVC
jgi:hypothetical protein